MSEEDNKIKKILLQKGVGDRNYSYTMESLILAQDER